MGSYKSSLLFTWLGGQRKHRPTPDLNIEFGVTETFVLLTSWPLTCPFLLVPQTRGLSVFRVHGEGSIGFIVYQCPGQITPYFIQPAHYVEQKTTELEVIAVHINGGVMDFIMFGFRTELILEDKIYNYGLKGKKKKNHRLVVDSFCFLGR